MSLQGYHMCLNHKPPSPPPKVMPPYCPVLKEFMPFSIQQNLNHFIYVWTIFGNSFWMYLVEIKGNILFSYAWEGSNWKHIQFSVNLVDCFF